MNTIVKTSMALAVAGVLSAAAITPSAAQNRAWVAAGAGFAAGALIGAAAATANNGYYYTAPAYGYAAEPDYVYEPAPAYYYARTWGGNIGSPNYNYNPYTCSSDDGYGRRSGCDR
jgi:hypothetical protein